MMSHSTLFSFIELIRIYKCRLIGMILHLIYICFKNVNSCKHKVGVHEYKLRELTAPDIVMSVKPSRCSTIYIKNLNGQEFNILKLFNNPLVSSFVYIKCLSKVGLHAVVNRIIEYTITFMIHNLYCNMTLKLVFNQLKKRIFKLFQYCLKILSQSSVSSGSLLEKQLLGIHTRLCYQSPLLRTKSLYFN